MPKQQHHRWTIEIRPEHMGEPGATDGSQASYGVFVSASPERPLKVWTVDYGVVLTGDGYGGHAALTRRSPSNRDAHALLTSPTRFASTVPFPVTVHCERADRPSKVPGLDEDRKHATRLRAIEAELADPSAGTLAEKVARASRKAA